MHTLPGLFPRTCRPPPKRIRRGEPGRHPQQGHTDFTGRNIAAAPRSHAARERGAYREQALNDAIHRLFGLPIHVDRHPGSPPAQLPGPALRPHHLRTAQQQGRLPHPSPWNKTQAKAAHRLLTAHRRHLPPTPRWPPRTRRSESGSAGCGRSCSRSARCGCRHRWSTMPRQPTLAAPAAAPGARTAPQRAGDPRRCAWLLSALRPAARAAEPRHLRHARHRGPRHVAPPPPPGVHPSRLHLP